MNLQPLGDRLIVDVLDEEELTVSGIVLPDTARDRKSTRLNSSHDQISYAVFCLKKKKKTHPPRPKHTPLAPAPPDLKQARLLCRTHLYSPWQLPQPPRDSASAKPISTIPRPISTTR